MENFLKNFVLIFFPKIVAKVVLFSMPKQVKEKAKMWYFAFLEAAHFAHSEKAGNPRFCCLSAREIMDHLFLRFVIIRIINSLHK